MRDGQSNPARDLALTVFETSGRLVGAGNELVAGLGLTSAWWQVLGALRYSPEPLPVASIGRKMGLTRQAVQRIVDLLAERGMVGFEPNPNHQRAKLVVLTEAGLSAVAAAEEAVAPVDRAIVERVGARRIAEAIETLGVMNDVLTEHLQSQGGAPKPRQAKKGTKT